MSSFLRLASIEMPLVFLVILSVASCANSDSLPLDAARSAVRDGDFARAVGFYQTYLEDQPDDYEVLKEYTFTLGERWAYDGGDRGPIIRNLERLYELRPSEEDVQGLLSLMLVREGQAGSEAGRFEESEQIYRRAIAVNPEAGLAQYNLGMLYDKQGKGDQAFAQYRAAAAKRPQIPDLYLRLGEVYLGRGDFDRAIVTLGLVVELSGVSTYLLPQAHCGIARAYHSKGMMADAVKAGERAGDECELGS
ncbi:MAG: tetratricopeptide repeat protein [Acidobacteriota bacterium]|nr:tetratricopeptide repeat protein [Acidobacteriota bacterium]